ncbi:hypothetical protein SLS64_009261 [Diaporthe eres]
MDEEKAVVPAADKSEHDALPSLARKEEEAVDLDVEAASVRSDRTQHEGDDLENHNDMGHQLSNTTGGSVWSSEQMSLPQEILFVATVCLTQFCNQASFCAMLFLLDTVGDSLGVTDPSLLSWLVAGFSLTAGTFLIFSGRLGDAFGYKLMLMIGFSWFSLWSVLAGVAVYSGYTLFVFARVFQGIGSAICIPNALAILGAAYPPGHRKAMVFALFGASAPVGAMTGGISGTALDLLWWPWNFHALAIVLALLTVLTYFVVPSPRPPRLSGKVSLRRLNDELDLVGAISGVSALILFNFAWNQAPIVGWNTAQVIATLVAGVVVFFMFIWTEYRYAVNPLLPLDAFNADAGFVLSALACGWAMFGTWSLYIVLIPFGMDMSFPAATLILSDAVKKEHQGIAASLVATVVNYSISLGVGFAGTVEVHVNNGGKTKADLLRGYKGALYLGVGLAGLGLVICLVFLARDKWKSSRKIKGDKATPSLEPGSPHPPAINPEHAAASMTLWKSPHPDIEIPTNVTTWEWLFESEEYVPFRNASSTGIGAYNNAVTKERLDFTQVKAKATTLSTVLVEHYGLRAGQTVSVFSTNTVWINGASPAYDVEEMTHALKTADTKILVTLPGSIEAAVAAAKDAGIPRSHILLLEGKAPGFKSVQDLIEQGHSLPPTGVYHIPHGKTNKEICGYLNFSSGTTGYPKAVMLSHHNIIAQCLQLRQLQLLPADGHYRTIAVMPLFHITGLVRFITYPVFMNGECFMLPQFKMETMLETIIAHRIEELIFVPPILIRIVRDPVVERYLSQLRGIVRRFSSGSAPMSPEILRLLEARFPGTGFRQGYGATESTACISSHPPSHFAYRYAHTGGKLVANTVAKVIDLSDASRLLGPGETGEICARGPQIAMGYLGNPEATAESFDEEGYLHTGDVGHIDAEGLLHIEDRIKEMIKVKGIQVAPAELEDVLMGHELVEDCAVLGIRDEYAGERPKAYVVVKKQVGPSEEMGRALLRYVRERKVRYKWLAEVEFAESIPKGPTGKLLRRLLKASDQNTGRTKGLCVRDDIDRAKL